MFFRASYSAPDPGAAFRMDFGKASKKGLPNSKVNSRLRFQLVSAQQMHQQTDSSANKLLESLSACQRAFENIALLANSSADCASAVVTNLLAYFLQKKSIT